jgi:hypothetical protein
MGWGRIKAGGRPPATGNSGDRYRRVEAQLASSARTTPQSASAPVPPSAEQDDLGGGGEWSERDDPGSLETAAEGNSGKHIRIVDWYLLGYAVFSTPLIGFLALIFVPRGLTLAALGLFYLWIIALELRGVKVSGTKIRFPVRLQLYGPYPFPMYLRTIRMDAASEATAETRHTAPFGSLRIMYITGDFGQAKVWFASKGYRDRLFNVLRSRGGHIRQYRGR